MKRAWTALALLGVGLTSAAPASAWCRMTTSPRQPTAAEPCIYPDPDTDPPERFLEWERPCSAIALSVEAPSDDLSEAEVLGVLERSIETWETVECDGTPLGIDIAILEERSTCVAPLYRDDGGNVNTVMFVQDWGDRMYDPAAFAVTTVWHRRSTGEILDADMEVNERRGPYGICPPDGCSDERIVDLENVFTHELGHYLGLAHSAEPEATMFASAVAGETTKRTLTADDVEGMCEVYPEGTPAGECDYAPRGGLRLDCEEGGCAVSAPGRSDARGRLGLAALGLLGWVLARRRR
ncbi:MAG TPA: matrixin family metalloprotease [Sandaracinaceae bacterium LLY-WYZ-13_1]|nr:matrixin family metalloprotease [Sandaracinaceae bacterium LLY-WYZ-13_1]